MPGHSFEDRQRKAGYDSFVRAAVDRTPAPGPAGMTNREFNETLEAAQRKLEQDRGTPLTGQGSTVNTQEQMANLDTNIVANVDKFEDIKRDANILRGLGSVFDSGPMTDNVFMNLGKLNLLGQKIPYNEEIVKILKTTGFPDYTPISELEGFSGIKGVGKLRAKQFSDIFGGIFGKDQTFRDEDGNIVDPNNIDASGPTLVDKTTGKAVSLTREGFLDSFEEGFFDKLKRDDPITYYKITDDQPQTASGIEDLANVDLSELGKSAEDRRLAARVMEARAFMSDKQSRQDANMGQASPAFAPPTAPPPGTPAPPPPTYPGFPGTPPPGLPTPPGITPVVTNYSNVPSYTQGGVQTFLGDPRFAQFRDTLNLFPRA